MRVSNKILKIKRNAALDWITKARNSRGSGMVDHAKECVRQKTGKELIDVLGSMSHTDLQVLLTMVSLAYSSGSSDGCKQGIELEKNRNTI